MTTNTATKIEAKEITPLTGKSKAAYVQLCGMNAGGGIRVGHAKFRADHIVNGDLVRDFLVATPNETFVDANGVTQFVLWASMNEGNKYLTVDGDPTIYRGENVMVPVERVSYDLARERNIGFLVALCVEADYRLKEIKTPIWKDLDKATRDKLRADAEFNLASHTIHELPYRPFAIFVKDACDAICAKQQAERKARELVAAEEEVLFGRRRAA